MELWLYRLSSWIWGPFLLILLLGTGVYLTVLLKGIQFRWLGHAFKLLLGSRKKQGEGDISPFQSLTTALAGSIGTGNVAGVATAITLGGVGALFWMWVSGLLGMAIQYAEAALAVRFRIRNRQGEMSGGPMYTIEQGLGWKWLGILFAIFAILASFGIGNLVQAHSIGDVLFSVIDLSPIWSGLILVVIVGVVLIGGIRGIGRVAEILVPGMAGLYLVGGIIILVIHYSEIPAAIGLIFTSAFTGQAAVGGFAGASATMALRRGLSRGLFSNEAGLGSGAIVAAAAATDQPGRQGLIAMTAPLFDTLIICTVTGLSLAVTGVLGKTNEAGVLITGAPLTVLAFDQSFPWGGIIVAIGLVLFALTTILSWAYYGEKSLEYLLGVRSHWIYRGVFLVVLFLGTILSLDLAWTLADIFNGLMAVPNLISLIGLSGVIVAEHRLYRETLS